ncbi:MAG: hypothetical protein CVV42_06115 [Candidatus Riflebacteria bacterium HGW-Riflebacteria-2]|jgi:hypothetical protein|nr:MAG: hypothetical protein CVV42_06115 [Candidatus Riflebacteria bacterium HGW-Riflebacteria-2]
MKRIILVTFLILGLCQSLWHSDRELLPYSTESTGLEFNEPGSSEATLSSPRPAMRFGQIFAFGRQQPLQLLHCRLKTEDQTGPSSFLPNRHRHRAPDDAVLPHEWGMTLIQFPRSDG